MTIALTILAGIVGAAVIVFGVWTAISGRPPLAPTRDDRPASASRWLGGGEVAAGAAMVTFMAGLLANGGQNSIDGVVAWSCLAVMLACYAVSWWMTERARHHPSGQPPTNP